VIVREQQQNRLFFFLIKAPLDGRTGFRLVDQGNSPEIVQRMLRWSSTRTLQRYVHPAKKTRRAQGEFLKRMNGKRARRRVQEKRSPKRRPA